MGSCCSPLVRHPPKPRGGPCSPSASQDPLSKHLLLHGVDALLLSPQHGTSVPHSHYRTSTLQSHPCRGYAQLVAVSPRLRGGPGVSAKRRCACPSVLLRSAGNALMLADARAHHKHAVASSWGHCSHRGHLPRPHAHRHPGVPPGDPICPRWPQGTSLVDVRAVIDDA